MFYIADILLYKRQLVVLTYELIYIVRLLTVRGQTIVKKIYSISWYTEQPWDYYISSGSKQNNEDSWQIHLWLLGVCYWVS